MPKNINFLLDSLFVDETYVVTGNTEPSIIYGLFGNVRFEPWKGFKQLINKAYETVESFSDEQLEETERSLQQARKFIAQKRESHLVSLDIQRQRKALLELKGEKDTTTSSANQDDDIQPNPVSEKDGEGCKRARKKPKRQPYQVRMPVTNSTSISDLHAHVMTALKDLLRVMYPKETFDLESRLISGENLMQDAPQGMIEEYMRKVMREDSPQLPSKCAVEKEKDDAKSSRPGAGENEVAAVTSRNVTTEGDQGQDRSFEELGNDGPGARGDAANDQKEDSALRRSSRIREKYSNFNKASLSSDQRERDNARAVPKKPVIKLSQTPDRCLSRTSLNDSGFIPICCYEFKGPTLNLSGLMPLTTDEAPAEAPAEDVSHENVLVSYMQDQPVASSSDLNVGDTGSEVVPDSEDDIYIPGLCGSAIAEKYNGLFSNGSEMSDDTEDSENEMLVLLPIAQVICQALLSKTGCVFLTNHQTAFALKIEEDKDKDFGAKVLVTGAIPCDKEPGHFAAMLGFTKYCVDTVLGQEVEDEMLNPNRRLLMRLSYAAYSADYAMKPLRPDWCPGGDANRGPQEQGPGAGRRRAVSNFTNNQSVENSSATVDHFDAHGLRNEEGNGCKSGADDVHTSSSPVSSASTAQQVDEAASESSDDNHVAQHKKSRSWMDERLKAMFSTTEGLLAVGSSGILLRGVWDGTQVAIKMWNGQSREGFLSIRREINVFERLQEKCPSVLGSAVPRFLLGWDRPQDYSVYRKEVILLTEFVGSGVSRDRNGTLWMDCGEGVEMVTSGEERLVCNAAMSSLQELHQNGFIHGDIALRNLRIMKKTESDPGWKAWWLDLGRTLEVNDHRCAMYFKLERARCLALFGLAMAGRGRRRETSSYIKSTVYAL